MSQRHRLTPAKRRLLLEMAQNKRVLLIQRDGPNTIRLRYTMTSFPMRRIRPEMVASLARDGYLTVDRRGYYTLTTKGMLAASLQQRLKKESA